MTPVLLEVSLTSIDPDPKQPRKFFDPLALEALGKSIVKGGLIQPIQVREHPDKPFRYLIVTGERRYRAVLAAGLETIQCVKIDDAADIEELQLIENIHREDFTPLEQARAFKRLIDKHNLTHTALAAKIHKPRVNVTESLTILTLPGQMIRALESGQTNIPKSHLILIAKQSDSKIQMAMWKSALGGRLTVGAARSMANTSKVAGKPQVAADSVIRALETAVSRLDTLESLTDEQLEPLNALMYRLGKILTERQVDTA